MIKICENCEFQSRCRWYNEGMDVSQGCKYWMPNNIMNLCEICMNDDYCQAYDPEANYQDCPFFSPDYEVID